MDAEEAKAKLSAVANELGHQIRVLMNSASAVTTEASASSTEVNMVIAPEEPDDFYEFTPEDYYRIMSDRIGAQSQVLKTRKVREAEAAARRARITKAVIRVLFPDNYILEAKFQPSERIQDLVDLLKKVLAQPNIPFYLYTTPPKQRVKDMSKDFYSAGFAPGAIVYFSYDLPQGPELEAAVAKSYLRDDILSLKGLDLTSSEQVNNIHVEDEAKPMEIPSVNSDSKPPPKKPTKPKWLKL